MILIEEGELEEIVDEGAVITNAEIEFTPDFEIKPEDLPPYNGKKKGKEEIHPLLKGKLTGLKN